MVQPKSNTIHFVACIIPVIIIIWSIYLVHINGYFFIYSIDPEYPYLINGLGISILDFNRIGHIDHPGTPFQILTAIFLRITHLIAGHGSIVDDVIARPEFYLSWSSFYLTLITAMIIFWLGEIVFKFSKNLTGTLIIQSSLFLNIIVMDVLSRYIPDRFQIIITLVFIGIILKYLYEINDSSQKFAILSGVLMGLGFMTKINFLPVCIVSLLILKKHKERLIYLGSFLLTAFVSFLPVIKKRTQFSDFVQNILFHDGLYGQGAEQIINTGAFFNNIITIIKQYFPFSLALVLSIVLLILSLIRPALRKKTNKELLMLLSFVLLSLIGILMIAKHFKNYYVVSVVTFTGFIYYLIWRILKSSFPFKYYDHLFFILLLVLIIVPFRILIPDYKSKIRTRRLENIFVDYCRNNISKHDYVLIEPTWRPGPLPENGLVYGMSYAGKRHLYFNSVEKYYPNILTWEGENSPVKFFRLIDADIKAIMYSGSTIYILSTPGRNAQVLCDFIETTANDYGINIRQDTVFSSAVENAYLIKFTNLSRWKTINSAFCGFEKVYNDVLYSDDERVKLDSSFVLTDKLSYNGTQSLKLDYLHKRSPSYLISGISKGDFLEFSIKYASNNDRNDLARLVFSGENINPNSDVRIDLYQSEEIKAGWKLQRISVEIVKEPLLNRIVCFFQYSGNNELYIDDFAFKHFSGN